MRLSNDKIHDLADQILDLLRKEPNCGFLAGEDAIRVAIGSAFLDDFREEEEIDQEAEKLLDAHAAEIEKGDMDVFHLRNKFKQQIARQRGFTL